jgi:hypothetical protein
MLSIKLNYLSWTLQSCCLISMPLQWFLKIGQNRPNNDNAFLFGFDFEKKLSRKSLRLIMHIYGGIEGTSEIFYLSRAHAMEDIIKILSVACARDWGHRKIFKYHVRTRFLPRAHAMTTTCARDSYYVCTYNL